MKILDLPKPRSHPLLAKWRNLLLPLLAITVLAIRLPAEPPDWPDYRGPWSNGHVQAPDCTQPVGLPLHWSETNNIKWKTEINFKGWSTPAIMGGQIWLTTATEDGHDFFVLSFDAQSGRCTFRQKLFHCDTPESLGTPLNSYATPSPVVESNRVYVHFGSYGTACLDAGADKVLWTREDLLCAHHCGPSSSPVLFQNLLILTLDGADLQYTIALDKETGRTVWKADRSDEWNPPAAPGKRIMEGDKHKAHSTPVILTVSGNPVLFSADARGAHVYDPQTGKENGVIPYDDYSPAPSPVYDNGLAIFVTGLVKVEMWAVQLDNSSGVIGTNIVWKLRQNVGKFASPLLVDGLVYTAAEQSFLTCLQAKDGQIVWTERIGGGYLASPIYADGRLYFFNQQGTTTVLKPGRNFEVLATNTLAEGLIASPAVTEKALILRTRTHLYRVESNAVVK
jgi:outer membrane protein assembly factor BamB